MKTLLRFLLAAAAFVSGVYILVLAVQHLLESRRENSYVSREM
jgi:hypothetical protein